MNFEISVDIGSGTDNSNPDYSNNPNLIISNHALSRFSKSFLKIGSFFKVFKVGWFNFEVQVASK